MAVLLAGKMERPECVREVASDSQLQGQDVHRREGGDRAGFGSNETKARQNREFKLALEPSEWEAKQNAAQLKQHFVNLGAFRKMNVPVLHRKKLLPEDRQRLDELIEEFDELFSSGTRNYETAEQLHARKIEIEGLVENRRRTLAAGDPAGVRQADPV